MRLSPFQACRKGLSAALMALLVGGCATGGVSPAVVMGPERISSIQAASKPRRSGECFEYGDRGTGSSLRPGDRLQLEVLSLGIQDYSYNNTYPPLVRTIDLPLRQVSGALDPAEQQTLATFLHVNRSKAWNHVDDNTQEGLIRKDRQALAETLQAHQTDLWNVLIGNLCVKTRASTAPEGVPILVVEAKIRDLCAVLPDDESKRLFARAFLVVDAASQEYVNGCGAATIPREPMTLIGLRNGPALGGWAAGAMAGVDNEADNYYAMDVAIGSPRTVQGLVSFDAVRPFRQAPPQWSLTAWEESGICQDAAKAPLVIKSVRLRGGGQTYRLVEDDKFQTTHIVEVKNGRRQLVTIRRQLGDWSLPAGALNDLTATDVDGLVWAASREKDAPAIKVAGCDARAER